MRDKKRELLSRLLKGGGYYRVVLSCCGDPWVDGYDCLTCDNYRVCFEVFKKYDWSAFPNDEGIEGVVLTLDEAKQLAADLKKINPNFEITVIHVINHQWDYEMVEV